MEVQQSQQILGFRVLVGRFARLGLLGPVGLRLVVLQLAQAQVHRGGRAPLGRTFCPTCLWQMPLAHGIIHHNHNHRKTY